MKIETLEVKKHVTNVRTILSGMRLGTQGLLDRGGPEQGAGEPQSLGYCHSKVRYYRHKILIFVNLTLPLFLDMDPFLALTQWTQSVRLQVQQRFGDG